MANLQHNVPIYASPAKVYAAIATQKGIRAWWTRDTVMTAKIGGKAEFGFENRGMVFRMDIKTLDAGKKVVMKCHGDHPEWNGTTLTWTIAKEDGESVLHFTHSGWKEVTDFCASCNSMWGNLMFRLKKYAETGKANPQWKK